MGIVRNGEQNSFRTAIGTIGVVVVVITLACTLFVVGAVIVKHTSAATRGATYDPWKLFGALFVVVAAVGAGVYQWLKEGRHEPRVLRNGDIEVRGLFGTRSIDSESIEGFRRFPEQGTIVLYGLDGDSLLTTSTGENPEFIADVADLFVDLGMQGTASAREALLSQIGSLSVLAPTRYRAAVASWALLGCSVLIALWAVADAAAVTKPAFRTVLAGAFIGLAPAAVSVSFWSLNMAPLYRPKENPHNYPSLLWPYAIGTLGLAIYAHFHYTITSRGLVVVAMVLGTIAVVSALHSVLPPRLSRATLLLGLAPCWLYGSVNLVNATFGTPLEKTYVTAVVDSEEHSSKFGTKSYVVELAPWREGTAPVTESVRQPVAASGTRGHPVVVREATGCLGIPWIVDVNLASKELKQEFELRGEPFEIE